MGCEALDAGVMVEANHHGVLAVGEAFAFEKLNFESHFLRANLAENAVSKPVSKILDRRT